MNGYPVYRLWQATLVHGASWLFLASVIPQSSHYGRCGLQQRYQALKLCYEGTPFITEFMTELERLGPPLVGFFNLQNQKATKGIGFNKSSFRLVNFSQHPHPPTTCSVVASKFLRKLPTYHMIRCVLVRFLHSFLSAMTSR